MKKIRIAALLCAVLLLTAACSGGGGDYPGADGAAAPDYAEQAPAPKDAPAAPEGDRGGGQAASDDSYDEELDGYGEEAYLTIDENVEKAVEEDSLLTFSLKVDTAAYTNVARYIRSGMAPPVDAVRTEELINYFPYEEKMPARDDAPFSIYTEIGPSPFDGGKHMAMIRVKTEKLEKGELPGSNLTFLIDTSGSMNSHDKLPLLKEAFAMLVETLDADDVVSIVTYAGSSGIALDSVSGADKDRILDVIAQLQAGGSTAGSNGIMTAYGLAEKNYRAGGNNRIVLATDGDFNVGISDIGRLTELIAEKRDSGVYLSVLGFGTGNIRDDIMETLSANGNGNYAYIDSVATAQKVLVEEVGSNLFTVADDVKAQVEFNPAHVKSYRLIGYENRKLSSRDFDDDTKDAGEIGVGTDVVILLELELQGYPGGLNPAGTEQGEYGDALFEVRIRYKNPGETESRLALQPVTLASLPDRNGTDYRFACAVAAFGHLLRESEYAGDVTPEQVKALAEEGLGADEAGYRSQFLDLLEEYRRLS